MYSVSASTGVYGRRGVRHDRARRGDRRQFDRRVVVVVEQIRDRREPIDLRLSTGAG